MTYNFKHTPAPWWCNGKELGTAPMMLIKIASRISGANEVQKEGNRRLLDAAPELLAEAVSLYEMVKSMNSAIISVGGPACRPELLSNPHELFLRIEGANQLLECPICAHEQNEKEGSIATVCEKCHAGYRTIENRSPKNEN